MKYIKLLELFSIKDCYPYKNIPTVNPSYVIYNFSTDNYIYDVEFERLKDGWSAEHKIGNPFIIKKHKLTYDNVYRVTSTVIYITQEFIKKENPNFLIMNYVGTPTEMEETSINKMNKRSRLQNNYLKQIDGYTPKYYYRSHPETGMLQTACLFYKNSYDFIKIEEYLNECGYKNI